MVSVKVLGTYGSHDQLQTLSKSSIIITACYVQDLVFDARDIYDTPSSMHALNYNIVNKHTHINKQNHNIIPNQAKHNFL